MPSDSYRPLEKILSFPPTPTPTPTPTLMAVYLAPERCAESLHRKVPHSEKKRKEEETRGGKHRFVHHYESYLSGRSPSVRKTRPGVKDNAWIPSSTVSRLAVILSELAGAQRGSSEMPRSVCASSLSTRSGNARMRWAGFGLVDRTLGAGTPDSCVAGSAAQG